MSAKVPSQLTALVTLRAGKRCEYCHAPQIVTGQTFHVDHIIPWSLGGKTTAENLCLACPRCNSGKGSRTKGIDPRTKLTFRLFNPREDDWDKHFRWSGDWKRLIGRTPIGRATVATLKMNDESLQIARLLWRRLERIP